MKAKGRSIPARASNVFCSSRPKTTCKSASHRRPRSIFICCAARRVAAGASRSLSLRQKACCAIPTQAPASKNSHKHASSPWFLTAKYETPNRSEEHTSELQSLTNLVCRLLLEKKKNNTI